jgi:hypothetical protein
MIHKSSQPPAIEEEAAPPDMLDLGPRKPAWTAPQVIELEGATAIIRRAYARFSPDHPCHRHEPDYAPDHTSEGARVLTWRPPAVAEPVMRMAA